MAPNRDLTPRGTSSSLGWMGWMELSRWKEFLFVACIGIGRAIEYIDSDTYASVPHTFLMCIYICLNAAYLLGIDSQTFFVPIRLEYVPIPYVWLVRPFSKLGGLISQRIGIRDIPKSDMSSNLLMVIRMLYHQQQTDWSILDRTCLYMSSPIVMIPV